MGDPKGGPVVIDSIVRVLLHKHYPDEILLLRLSADEKTAVLTHKDGTIGAVPVDIILAMGWNK